MATLAERIAVVIDGDSSGAVQAFGQGSKGAQKFDYDTQQAARRVSYALAAVGVAATAMAVKSASKFQEVGAEVKALGRITGDTAEQSSKLRFAAHETGVEINTLATGVRTLEKHLVANDTAAKSLGISYRNSAGQLLPFNVILARTADVFAGMPDGPQKTALAIQLFGRSGAALIPMLNRGSSGLTKMGDEAQRLGLVLDAGAIKKVDEATKASRDLSASMDAVQVAIGSNVLPVVTKLKEAAASGLGFIAAHKETATLAAGATVAAGALGTLGGAASNVNEIVQTGTLLLSKWRSRSAVAENVALAASYDKVAASATAATVAETTAGAAAGGGGVTTPVVVAKKKPSVVGVGKKAGIGGPLTIAAAGFFAAQAFSGGHDARGLPSTDNLAAKSTKDLRVELEKLNHEAAKGGIFERRTAETRQLYEAELRARAATDQHTSALKRQTDVVTHNAQANYDAAARDARTAEKRLRDARQFVSKRKNVAQLAGLDPVDLFAAPPKSNVASARSSANSAAASLADARDSEARAEMRLASVRGDGKSSAYELRSAEDALAAAKRRVALASDASKTADKNLADARKGTALSIDQVVGRAVKSRKDQEGLARDYHRLVKAGITKPVLEELRDLEKQAPGTLDAIAGKLSPHLVDRLNRNMRKAEHAHKSAEAAFAWAYTRDAKVAADRAAEASAEAYKRAFLRHLGEPGAGRPARGRFMPDMGDRTPRRSSRPAEHRGRDDRRDGLLKQIVKNTAPRRGTVGSPGYS